MKLLKPGGSIFITTVNKTLISWLGAILFAEYILNIVPRYTHEWNKFIPPHQVQYILGKCKFYTSICFICIICEKSLKSILHYYIYIIITSL